MKIKTKQLTQTAIMLALATALSLIPLGVKLPFGGTITPLSMVPVILIVVMYRGSYGMLCAFLYSVIQAAISFGSVSGWGLTPTAFVGTLLLDYIIAYSVIGVISLFGRSAKQTIIGIVVAMLLRFICHVISGIVIFSEWMVPEIVELVGSNIVIYSISYNAIFFGPEAILTIIGGAFIPRILQALKSNNAIA